MVNMTNEELKKAIKYFRDREMIAEKCEDTESMMALYGIRLALQYMLTGDEDIIHVVIWDYSSPCGIEMLTKEDEELLLHVE